ncbi:MAG: glucose-6-phosphate isomerase [Rhodospirillaceae bacterium]|nr:glucose-6-phosphate isomerase [Rhodospirillaceae bacterium]
MANALTASPAWQALSRHAESAARGHLRELFAADPGRFAALSLRHGPLLVDLSKQRVTTETLALLIGLARARGVEQGRAAMFAGARINATEHRAVLHVALRNRADRPMRVDGVDVMPEVRATLARLKAFSDRVADGSWTGASGKPIRHIVNIGIGGSHLGPMFAADALAGYRRPGVSIAFVSNPDRAQIDDVLAACDPAATLFVIASKTFTTVETMSNAAIARAWIADAFGEAAIARHFAAVSTNLKAAAAFGIPEANVFPMWDWVGGRYSLWSAIGLPVMLACGFDAFNQLLDGAHAMDRHFESAPLAQNLPALLALIGVWNINFLGCDALAVLPYDHRLKLLPAHLQQLDMESNGKSVTLAGDAVGCATGPIVFGAGGSDSQHSFFQLLHQGPRIVPCDFIVALKGPAGFDASRDLLVANAFAQTEALMNGRTAADLASTPPALKPHRAFTGNRPTTTIVLDELTPSSLGQLIALYEHKVFVQGLIWGVNSFDQWGVELGKELATALGPALAGAAAPVGKDTSTSGLVAAYLEAKRRSV